MTDLQPDPSQRERRLEALLEGRDELRSRLHDAVQDAQTLGSLALARVNVTAIEMAAARSGRGFGPVAAQLTALRAVAPPQPFGREALLAWQRALCGASRFRAEPRARPEGPPTAPPEWIEARLHALEEWLGAEGFQDLPAAAAGALVMARILEIQPFADGNGRIARLAASHVMVQRGARPPILQAGDFQRLDDATRAAFRLETQPLTQLLEEASERALDLMLRMAAEATPP